MQSTCTMPKTGFRSTVLKAILLSLCLITGQLFLYAEGPVKDNTLNKEPVAVVSAAAADSVKAAAIQAAADAEAMRKESVNTVLEVVGSVLAIFIIVFVTWKMSSGPAKSNQRPAPSGGGGSSPRPAPNQRVMRRVNQK
jgi:hypothetical protein